MFSTAFSFEMGNPVQEHLVSIVRIDGVTPSLACVSVGGKVFLYTPSGVSHLEGSTSSDQQLQFLNLNKSIKSIQSA